MCPSVGFAACARARAARSARDHVFLHLVRTILDLRVIVVSIMPRYGRLFFPVGDEFLWIVIAEVGALSLRFDSVGRAFLPRFVVFPRGIFFILGIASRGEVCVLFHVFLLFLLSVSNLAVFLLFLRRASSR